MTNKHKQAATTMTRALYSAALMKTSTPAEAMEWAKSRAVAMADLEPWLTHFAPYILEQLKEIESDKTRYQ